MGALRGTWARLGAMVGRRAADASLDEEIRFHLEMETEKNVRAGMAPAEARRVALATFGGVQRVREEHRDGRRLTWIEDLLADLRFGARSLRRTPGVTLAIVLTLAVGLGANATIFSVIDRVFFRLPAAVAQPEHVLRLYDIPEHPQATVPAVPVYNYPKYAAMRAAIGPLATVAAYTPPGRTRVEDGSDAEVFSSNVDSGYFPLLGVRPALGRLFAAEEERIGQPPYVLVLSYDYWQKRFRGDSAVIGRRLRVGDAQYTIIGVAQQGFTGVDLDDVDFWRPLADLGGFRALGSTAQGPPWYEQRGTWFLRVLARPMDGAGPLEIAARATTGFRRDSRAMRLGDSLATIATGSLLESRGPAKRDQEFSIAASIAVVALIVLFIACANVANLLLARATERRREIAVRLAMGISRSRLARMLFAESAALAALAAAAAFVTALWASGVLRALLLPDAHWQPDVHGARIVTFTVAAALFTACATAIAPALQSTRTDLNAALKSGVREGGGHRSRMRSLLVVTQSALAAVLVIGAGLFVRSLENVASEHIGYDVDRLVFVTPSGNGATPPVEQANVRELQARLAALPYVERTARVSNPPMWGFSFFGSLYRASGDSLRYGPGAYPVVTPVSASFFPTVGTRLLRGRVFSDLSAMNDGRAAIEVVVNREMARQYWPGVDPIGQCIRFDARTAPCYSIVGIVENARRASVLEQPEPAYYVPVGAPPVATFGMSWIAVRAAPGHTGDVAAAARALAGGRTGSDMPQVMVMSEMLSPQYHAWRLGAWLFTALACLALLVAAIGVYSTLTYAMSQRTHEMGVRVALGARAADVARVVIRSSLSYALAGVSLGILLALAFGRLVASLLYGVSPHDPETMVTAAIVLLVSACVAAMVPAWRAARVDPAVALRAET